LTYNPKEEKLTLSINSVKLDHSRDKIDIEGKSKRARALVDPRAGACATAYGIPPLESPYMRDHVRKIN
jgi:hypothetical protein